MKAMFEVIKHEGDVTNLVYKFEGEDFNTKSRLVVQQGQEAIFYYKGQIADRFAEQGTYVLDTQNIPILRHLVNLPFGKESPFHAVVYFVNKTEQMNNKWGVGSIPFVDRKQYNGLSYEMPLRTGVSGEYNYKVNNAEVLMDKLVGTQSEFSGTKFKDNLDSILKSRVVDHMSKYYQENELDIFVIESKISEIATYLEARIKEDFYDYGIEITKFVVTSIVKAEDSTEYKRYFEFRTQQQAIIDIKNKGAREAAEAEARMNVSIIEQTTQQDLAARGKRVDADAEKYRREQEKITSREEHAFRVAEMTAQNEGAGNFASAGMGIGMGIGAMGAAAQTVGGIYNDALSNINLGVNQPAAKQEQAQDDVFAGVDLGLGNDTTKETSKAVPAQSEAKASRRERLQELKELLEDGLITQEEFDAKKKAIIDEV